MDVWIMSLVGRIVVMGGFLLVRWDSSICVMVLFCVYIGWCMVVRGGFVVSVIEELLKLIIVMFLGMWMLVVCRVVMVFCVIRLFVMKIVFGCLLLSRCCVVLVLLVLL